jgi:hypothetical protein
MLPLPFLALPLVAVAFSGGTHDDGRIAIAQSTSSAFAAQQQAHELPPPTAVNVAGVGAPDDGCPFGNAAAQS